MQIIWFEINEWSLTGGRLLLQGIRIRAARMIGSWTVPFVEVSTLNSAVHQKNVQQIFIAWQYAYGN